MAYHFKKIVSISIYSLFLLISVLSLLEISYRIYLLDFYKNELLALNPAEGFSSESRPCILAMGDSFTADPASYIENLRDAFPNYKVINSGVPGICVREASLMASTRIKKFNPEIFIYQIYVGNDLWELKPPNISNKISLSRRFFWWLSDKINVLRYLNFRFRFIRQMLQAEVENGMNPKDFENFSVDNYSPRTKMMLQADPTDLENSILLRGNRDKDMIRLMEKLNKMLAKVPKECQIYILLIPHCIQLNSTYQLRMDKLGAVITSPTELLEPEFPFYQRLSSEFKRENVKSINTLPLLREASLLKPVYFENDPHLNKYGQAIIGQHLVDLIRKDRQIQ